MLKKINDFFPFANIIFILISLVQKKEFIKKLEIEYFIEGF